MATRLTLKNGQWFDVKDKLKVRDKKDIHRHSNEGMSTEGERKYTYNVVAHQAATAAVRILNWNLQDPDADRPGHSPTIPWPVGKTFKERVEAVENLDEDVFDELSELLTATFQAQADEAQAEKNETPATETASGPSSRSVN